jgi:hypothetical protein
MAGDFDPPLLFEDEMTQIYVDRRSELGIAEDTRRYVDRLRRADLRKILTEAKVKFSHDATANEMRKIAIRHNVNLEKTAVPDIVVIGPEPSIHDLRKQVHGLTKPDGGQWEWNEVTKMSKDQLRGILNGDNASSGG